MSNPNTDRDERVRRLISELSNIEFEARGLARSRYHDRLFAIGKPRPTNEQFDEGWSAARNFYLEHAATRMRDRCVAKVAALAEDYSDAWARQALKDAAREINSLTLEQGEQEK